MRVAAGLLLLAALLPPARADEPTARELLEAVEAQLKTVSEKAGPAVACVVVSRSEHYPGPPSPDRPGRLGGFDPKEFVKNDPARAELARRLDLSDPKSVPDHLYCGGVVIDPAGLVLVNHHSIEGATKVYVHLPGGRGSYADIHAADARSDLAVLRLITPPDGLVPARLGEVRTSPGEAGPANVFPGKLVALLVHPFVTGFAMDRPSSGLGSLTNVRKRPAGAARDEARDGRTSTVYHYGTFLEHDARLNPGHSGGALFNLDGELIGLTTTVAAVTGGEAGPGYALPIDGNARRVIDVLRRGEEVEYGFLGIHLGNSVGGGVPVADLTRQGPAEAAGLRPGEVITRVNDNPVADSNDLFLHVGHALAGSTVKVRVTGGTGQPRDVDVTLGKFQHSLPWIASVRPDPVFGLRVDYGSVLAQQIGLSPRVSTFGVPAGVAVRELVPGSPAAARLGGSGPDVPRVLITHLDGTPIPTPDAFYRAAKGRRAVRLTVLDPLDPTRPRDITLP